MFIYILAKDCNCAEYIEDTILIATTNIQKILDYLTVDKMRYANYELLICEDGEQEENHSLYVNTNMSYNLEKYTPAILWTNKNILNELISKIKKWEDEIKKEREEQRRKEEEEKSRKQEEKDRALYEKLKAKFEEG